MERIILRRVTRTVKHQLVGSAGDASGLGSLLEGLDGLTASSVEGGAGAGLAAVSLRLLALECLEMVVMMPFISSSKSCMWWPYCKKVQ